MICLSLLEPTVKRMLHQIRTLHRADLLEIRLDALEEPKVAPFLDVASPPLLFTFRALGEGGLRDVPLETRLNLLREAAKGGAFAVDLELASGEEAILGLRHHCEKTKLLLSFHDFRETPPLERLQGVVEEMKRLGADWGKVVTMARDTSEALEVLRLIPWARRELGFPLTAFAMGPQGKFSRVVCLLLGAPLTYAAPPGGKAAAPGQISGDKLRQVLEILDT